MDCLHVAEDHLEGDCRVESGQLEGIPVFFCELQPSSCLSQAVWDLSFWRGAEHDHHDLGSCCTALAGGIEAEVAGGIGVDHDLGEHHELVEDRIQVEGVVDHIQVAEGIEAEEGVGIGVEVDRGTEAEVAGVTEAEVDHSSFSDQNHGRQHHGVRGLGGHGSHGGRLVQHGAIGEA